ncbi:nitrite reductase [Nocardioides sp. SR21]|uniref:nitrite reductase n=1 Tax=Nocardioides sp. SR21 TaxID=2919501 RepID=UPI001FAB2F9C|nr:nitrite reductase [Nocardioides sp. SR21]
MTVIRDRGDKCPGAMRPWEADDGMLVRLRLIGGRIPSDSLCALVDAAERYGDGRVHLTARANVQVRAFPGADGRLDDDALAALDATGLLPTRTHELVRNVMVSPQSGLAGGRADLRPVAAELDRLVCASPALAGLPGRFLFVLDDGRGDLVDRTCDLGLVVLDEDTAQLRVGGHWGEVVALDAAAAVIVDLAHDFVDRRGAAWHVAELDRPLAPALRPDARVPSPSERLPHGLVPGGRHVVMPAGIDRPLLGRLDAPELVVTPWRGVLVPEETR